MNERCEYTGKLRRALRALLFMKYVYGDLTLCTYSFIIDAYIWVRLVPFEVDTATHTHTHRAHKMHYSRYSKAFINE